MKSKALLAVLQGQRDGKKINAFRAWLKDQPEPVKIEHLKVRPHSKYASGEVYFHRNVPEAGEITLREWIALEAERLNVTTHTIQQRVYRGFYPGLEARLRRVNRRVVFVRGKTL